MKTAARSVRLTGDIHWVGYVDWTVRDFHSYHTVRGSTYNAYLIEDKKKVLIDTVKAPYAGDLLGHLRERLKGVPLDYIVMNHVEPDHAGSISRVMESHPGAVLVCTEKSRDILSRYHNTAGWRFHTVGTGDRLDIGNRSLQFLQTPMVHWPDSMFTYDPRERVLFSMDAFGQHYASSGRFDDEVNRVEVMQEAVKYYANILMLYGRQIKRVLKQAGDFSIDMIAPSHGIIWRRHISDILEKYGRWVDSRPRPKVLVIYDSMWESTRIMAQAIARGVTEAGAEAKLLWVRASGLTDIATEVLDSAAIAFGSPTLNKEMMPMMGALLTYLKGLEPRGKEVLLFGSTGWGRGATEAMADFLRKSSLKTTTEPLKVFWRPGEGELERCVSAGRRLGEIALKAPEAKQG